MLDYFFHGAHDQGAQLPVLRRYVEGLDAPREKHLQLLDASAHIFPLRTREASSTSWQEPFQAPPTRPSKHHRKRRSMNPVILFRQSLD